MEVLIHGNLMTDHAFDVPRRASMAKNYNVFDSMQLSHPLIWILPMLAMEKTFLCDSIRKT